MRYREGGRLDTSERPDRRGAAAARMGGGAAGSRSAAVGSAWSVC